MLNLSALLSHTDNIDSSLTIKYASFVNRTYT